MEVDQKRNQRHAVAGVSENDSYCGMSNLGDRALSLFFEPWDSYEKPTYKACTYDIGRNSANVCEKIEF